MDHTRIARKVVRQIIDYLAQRSGLDFKGHLNLESLREIEDHLETLVDDGLVEARRAEQIETGRG